MARILFYVDSWYPASEDDDPPCMYDFYIKTLRWFTVFVFQKILQQKII